jgi:tetratricopeptide (TPR) repeat protein
MNSRMRDPRTARRRLSVRAGLLCVAVALLVAMTACGGKTPKQLAVDELNAGLAASGQGQTDQAVTHYKACLQHDSQNQYCSYNLGVIAQQAGHAAEAENDYRIALLIDPEFPSALLNLGILRAQAGSNEEAISIFRHFIQVKPDNAYGHLNLGLLLRAKGQTAEANKELVKAKQLDATVVIPTFEPSPSPTPSESPTPRESPSPTPK